MITVGQYLKSIGKSFPKADADGTIPMSRFTEANLPMVVQCTHCTMTMCLRESLPCTQCGLVYCDECGAMYEACDEGYRPNMAEVHGAMVYQIATASPVQTNTRAREMFWHAMLQGLHSGRAT